jgi:hypothetical protein
METLLVEAEALRNQLEAGNRSTAGSLGDALAVLMARASALGIDLNQASIEPTLDEPGMREPVEGDTSPKLNSLIDLGTGVNLNIQISETDALQDTSQNYVADMEALIRLATDEIARMDGGEGGETMIHGPVRDLSAHGNQTARKGHPPAISPGRLVISQKAAELNNSTQTNNQQPGQPGHPTEILFRQAVAGTLSLFVAVLIGRRRPRRSHPDPRFSLPRTR